MGHEPYGKYGDAMMSRWSAGGPSIWTISFPSFPPLGTTCMWALTKLSQN